ncbi:MAG: DUF134 domain-containing protein [Oscillospiraceae bacterium]
MARPIKLRRICEMPNISEFAPTKKSKTPIETVTLAVEEYEVIRLIDYLGFTQEECAAQMNVARTTVQAIYDGSRKKLADVLINGKKLSIAGGNYDVCVHSKKCCGKSCKNRKCQQDTCEKGEMSCADACENNKI